MVEEPEDLFEGTYGEFIVERVREIVEDVQMALPVGDGEDGSTEFIPFPDTLLYGDVLRSSTLESETYADWAAHLPDLVGRMAKEGVLLVLSALPEVGIQVESDTFALIADLSASFYARGYMIGMLEGADGAPSDAQMEEYLVRLQEDVDRQVAAMNQIETLLENIDEEETE